MRTPTPTGTFTFSGTFIDLPNFDEKKISILDIAVALSHSCRFNGNCYKFYSVAEHSIACKEKMLRYKNDADYLLAALMHDAHEAYIGDITIPVANTIETICPEFKTKLNNLKTYIDEKICKYLRLPIEILKDPLIKEIDTEILNEEFKNLICSTKEETNAYNSNNYTFNVQKVRTSFLDEFRILQAKRGVDYVKDEINNGLWPKCKKE